MLRATLAGRDKLKGESKYIELQVQSLKAELDKTSLDIEQNGLTKQQRELEDKQLNTSNPEFQLVDRQIELSKASLAQTEVVAPSAGTVLDVLAHAGEVGSGPLLRMGDFSAMVVVAEVSRLTSPSDCGSAIRASVHDPRQADRRQGDADRIDRRSNQIDEYRPSIAARPSRGQRRRSLSTRRYPPRGSSISKPKSRSRLEEAVERGFVVAGPETPAARLAEREPGGSQIAGGHPAAASLTMVLLQLGFLQAVRITATNNFDQLDFDVVLLSPRYEQFYAAGCSSARTAAAGTERRFGRRGDSALRVVQPVAVPPYPLDQCPDDRPSPSQTRSD